MKIGVDIRSLLVMSRGGIPQYTLSILRELIARHPDDEWILLQTGRRPYTVPPELDRPNVTLRHLKRPNRLTNAGLAAGWPKFDRFVGGVDVWFAPGLGFLRFSRGVPVVLTVHDLSFHRQPQWYGYRSRAWHRIIRPRALVKRADRVITVSQQTRSELTGVYGMPERKAAVIYSGIDEIYRKPISAAAKRAVRERYRLPESYFLYLGSVEKRKNLTNLLKAYQVARSRGLSSGLVLAGQGTDGRIAPVGLLKDVRQLGYVDEEQKPALYVAARGLALVSWHEGFGFPPLEALACGTPGVVSDLPIFQETLDGAALRANPADTAAIADSLVQLDSDERLRTRLVAAGAKRLPKFTWERAARETYRVLREAADAR